MCDRHGGHTYDSGMLSSQLLHQLLVASGIHVAHQPAAHIKELSHLNHIITNTPACITSSRTHQHALHHHEHASMHYIIMGLWVGGV
jgi:hypothetical protein